MDILEPYRKEEGYIIGDGQKQLTERTFIRMWQRIGRTINLYGATPHRMRHTYITLAASSGVDVKTLQEIAGHADIKMTMRMQGGKRSFRRAKSSEAFLQKCDTSYDKLECEKSDIP